MGKLSEQNRDRAARRRLYTPKCRSCGKPLRKHIHRWWSGSPDGPRPVLGCNAEHGLVLEMRPSRLNSLAESVVDYWCGKWGYGGNGYFCCLRCGYVWGVRELESKG